MLFSLSNDYQKMADNSVTILAEYIRINEIKSLVLGMSGGIDSTLTAFLARAAVDEVRSKGLTCDLMGFSIPIETNKADEINRSKMAMTAFCTTSMLIDQTESFYVILESMFPKEIPPIVKDRTMEEKIRAGNIKARMRMMYLYNAASRYNGLVLSTDNLTELMLGFWTLHGDVGDFGMLQDLWKTEVYGLTTYFRDIYKKAAEDEKDPHDFGPVAGTSLSKYKALDEAIKAVPTDGLGVSLSDFQQLGVDNYEEIDKILIQYMQDVLDKKELDKEELMKNPVLRRHLKTNFKRNNPFNISRKLLV